MADGEVRAAAIYCPEVNNPGKTGCGLAALEKKFEKIDLILNGTPDHPENGFVHQVLAYLENDKKRHWTRTQKLGFAAFAVPLLFTALWYATTSAYAFIQKVDNAIKAIDDIHKTRALPLAIPNFTGQIDTAHNQQDAAFELPETR